MSKDKNAICPPHLVVLDTITALKGEVRTEPGDCWCCTCNKPVPFWFNDGNPVLIEEKQA
jgi:hypothetical protein